MLCELNLIKTADDGCWVVELRGDAGFAGVDDLDRQLQIVECERPHHVILDLGELDFISSLGLGRIVAFVCRIRDWGGEVSLVGLQLHIRELFDTTFLSKVLDIRDEFDPSRLAG